MLRYKLRTLLIVLATAPVALALPWLNEPAACVVIVAASPFLLYLWVVP
jgi:hypothetical protein